MRLFYAIPIVIFRKQDCFFFCDGPCCDV